MKCSGVIIAHFSLKFLHSSYPPTLASRVAGTTGAHHHTRLIILILQRWVTVLPRLVLKAWA
ncbi:hypothetical protein AAY473_025223 [Plecturocebus cupreus]